MAAVFFFPLATVSHAIFIHSFLSLASLASQPKLLYVYEAEQSQVMDMWCRDEDAFKPGTGMYVSSTRGFLCRLRQLEIHVRAMVENNGGYR